MKKFLAFVMAIFMLAALCACGETKPDIKGTWVETYNRTAEDMKENLEYLQFDEAEIEFADLTACKAVDLVAFYEDGTYTLGFDATANEKYFRSYLEDYFAVLYENVDKLVDLYGEFECEDAAEFIDLYAYAYFDMSGEEMLEYMSDYLADLYNDEHGKYVVEKDRIGFMAEDETEYSYAGFKLSDKTLTVDFKDGTIVYRAK